MPKEFPSDYSEIHLAQEIHDIVVRRGKKYNINALSAIGAFRLVEHKILQSMDLAQTDANAEIAKDD